MLYRQSRENLEDIRIVDVHESERREEPNLSR
jgi:hypothetical protein